MLSMKKDLSILFSLLLLLVLSSFLLGCNREVTSVYTMKDGDVEYTLTLNETKGTFLLVEEQKDGRKEYEGEYTVKDGSLILASTNFGYRSVRLVGDSFEFLVNPDGYEEIKEPCAHVWDGGLHTPGNCKTYGSTVYTCLKCGEKKTETDKEYGGHVLDEGRHVNGKTCTDYGYTLYTCKICKEYTETVTDSEYTDNHVYEPTETIKDDGCTVILKRLYRCSRCGEEKYLAEDSRAIGLHDYDEVTGICNRCGHLKNGMPATHEFKKDRCYYCNVKKSVLEGTAEDPCGYAEDGKVYIGVYPQEIAPQTAKEIRANGLYDSTLDCWYYGHETYVIKKAEVRNDVDKTFSNGQKIEAGESYAFILQPLAFIVEEDAYVCETIVDSDNFLEEYVVINDGITNVWADSTLRDYLNGGLKRRVSVDEIESIDLLTEETLPTNKIKKVTDYALAGGMSYTEIDGERVGKWFLKTPAELSSEVKCVGYDGETEDVRVTAVRGIVPVVRLKQGE